MASRLEVREVIEDLSTNNVINTIFFKFEPSWPCADSADTEIEVDPVHFRLLKEFLFEYFKEQEVLRQKPVTD